MKPQSKPVDLPTITRKMLKEYAKSLNRTIKFKNGTWYLESTYNKWLTLGRTYWQAYERLYELVNDD
jgi:hypothetical protein